MNPFLSERERKDEHVWHKLGKRKYNLCSFDCIYKFYPEEKKSWSHGVRTNIKNVRFTWNVYLYQQTAKVIIKKTYIIVLKTVYIFFVNAHWLYKTYIWIFQKRNKQTKDNRTWSCCSCMHPPLKNFCTYTDMFLK